MEEKPKGPICDGWKLTEINLNSFNSPAETTMVSKVVVVIIYLYSENVLKLLGLQAMNKWFLNGATFRMSVGN